MAETVVVGGGDEQDESSPAEASAHEAAVAEGATAVQAEQAAESAAEAKAAAEAALSAAQANIEAGEHVEQAAAEASASAAQAGVSLEMIHDALKGQSEAISALTEELKASRRAAEPAKPKRAAPDRPPAGSGGGRRWRKA